MKCLLLLVFLYAANTESLRLGTTTEQSEKLGFHQSLFFDEDLDQPMEELAERVATIEARIAEADQVVTGQHGRIRQLEQTVQSPTVRLEQNETNYSNLQVEVMALRQERAAASDKALNIIDTRLVDKPREFAGSQDKWHGWVFKFKAYCGAVSDGMSELMKDAAASTTEIQMKVYNGTQRQYSKVLYYMLVMLCQEGSPAYSKIKGCAENNGMEAWRRFHAEYEPQVRGRFQSMLQGILAARFGNVSLQNISSELEEFEREVIRYEDQSKNKISEDMKAGIVIAGMCELKLKEHLEINTAKLDSYSKVKDEIKEYLTAKKKWTSVIGTKQKWQGGKDRWGSKGDKRDSKGKDKNKKGDPKAKAQPGKGPGGAVKKDNKKDQGNKTVDNSKKKCFGCQEVGHVKADCPKRKQQLALMDKQEGAALTRVEGDDWFLNALEEMPHCGSCHREANDLENIVGECEAMLEENLCMMTMAELEMAELNGEIEWLLLDSGSAAHGCPVEYATEFGQRGSSAGPLQTATGETTVNHGERTVKYVLSDGKPASVKFEVLNIKKPILSVGRLKATGHEVHLGDESWIRKGNRTLPVTERNKVFWVKAKRMAPDTMQERGMLNPVIEGGASSSSSASTGAAAASASATAEQPEHGEQKARAPPVPDLPTDQECEDHELTHIPLRSWCEWCLKHRAKDTGHFHVVGVTRGVPVIQMDFTFLTSEVDNNVAKVLNMTDCESDAISATMTPTKVANEFMIAYAVNAIDTWGRGKIIVRNDQEPAIRKVAEGIKEKRNQKGTETLLEQAPKHSHQSVGEVDGANDRLTAQVRTLMGVIEQRYGEKVSATGRLLPWAVRHSGFLITKFQKHSDGRTSHERLKKSAYRGELVQFGESVWYRKPGEPETKLDKRWDSGLFLGKVETSDEVLVGTPDGVVAARAIRRKPKAERWCKEEYLAFTAKPWNSKGQPNDTVVRERRRYITRALIERHGKTDKCQGCAGNSTIHNLRCRRRFETIFEEEEKRLKTAPVPPESKTLPKDDAEISQEQPKVDAEKLQDAEPQKSEGVQANSNTTRGEDDKDAEMDKEEELEMPEDAPRASGSEQKPEGTPRRRRFSRKRPQVENPEDYELIDPAATNESTKVQNVGDEMVNCLEIPNPDAWLEQTERVRKDLMCESILCSVTEGAGEDFQKELEAEGKQNFSKEEHERMRYYLVPEKGDIRGFLSGKKLNRLKVVRGRTLGTERMEDFKVYEWVREEAAAGKKKIPSKWCFDEKEDFVRSRPVCCEVAHEKREDTFAATPPLKGIKILIHCNTSKPPYGTRRRRLGRWDVSVAFFHAEIKEELYVRPPAGMRKPGWIWKLLRAMYGSRQASMLFQDQVAHVLVDIGGFSRCAAAPSMYFHEEHNMEALVHGDDFLADAEESGLQYMDTLLEENFLVKKLPRLGPGAEKQGTFIGRLLTYHDGKGFEYQAGTKHLPKILKYLGWFGE